MIFCVFGSIHERLSVLTRRRQTSIVQLDKLWTKYSVYYTHRQTPRRRSSSSSELLLLLHVVHGAVGRGSLALRDRSGVAVGEVVLMVLLLLVMVVELEHPLSSVPGGDRSSR